MLTANSARASARGERGVIMVWLSIMLPMIFVFGGIVIAVGSWYTHGRQLQTKVDAGALAAGGAWAFPCGPGSDSNANGSGIVDEARKYVGDHTAANGTQYTSTLNPQVSGVNQDDVYVTINQGDWWDDGFPGSDPLDPAVCAAKQIDVKATEDDTPFLFGWLPIWPDVKRKAVVRIEESAGNTGLLPIAVRIPRPLSAAAVFYDEDPAQNGRIIDVQYLREVCKQGVTYCVLGSPAGLSQWTTEPSTVGAAIPIIPLGATTGVVIASSFRPRCGTPGSTPPCLDDAPTGGTSVNAFCNQNNTVTCWDATGGPGAQSVVSGAQFIRGYSNNPTGTGAPQLRDVRLRGGAGCEPYFNSVPSACTAELTAEIDLGALEGLYDHDNDNSTPDIRQPLKASDVQVRYAHVNGDGNFVGNCDFGNSCYLETPTPNSPGVVTFRTVGSNSSPYLDIQPESEQNAVAIQVDLKNAVNSDFNQCTGNNFNVPQCSFFYTARSVQRQAPVPTEAQILAAPIQRSFMGGVDRTGPLRWIRLDIDSSCIYEATDPIGRLMGWSDVPPPPTDAASRPATASPCYVVNVALQGGMARDQDEPPIALLLGSGPGNRALVDCDPDASHGQVEDEIRDGCQWPAYRGNDFTGPASQWCPYSDDTNGSFFDVPKPAPHDDWPAFDCVLTRTGNANQIIKGFNQRLFGAAVGNGNPQCPTDDNSPYQLGRNYWHRANNDNDTFGFAWDGDGISANARRGAKFSDADKRVVNLFFTPYGSFTGPGNYVQELVGLGNFYITGYGFITGGGLQNADPCSDGASFPDYAYTANDPPPDLDLSKNTAVVWGHFIKDVPGGSIGGTGEFCEPELNFNPCTPVMIE